MLASTRLFLPCEAVFFDHGLQLGHHVVVRDQFAPVSTVDARLDKLGEIGLMLGDPSNRLGGKGFPALPAQLRNAVDEGERFGIDRRGYTNLRHDAKANVFGEEQQPVTVTGA